MQGYLPLETFRKNSYLSGSRCTLQSYNREGDPENVPWLIKMGTQWSAKDLETFNVEIKNGQVFVDVLKSQ